MVSNMGTTFERARVALEKEGLILEEIRPLSDTSSSQDAEAERLIPGHSEMPEDE